MPSIAAAVTIASRRGRHGTEPSRRRNSCRAFIASARKADSASASSTSSRCSAARTRRRSASSAINRFPPTTSAANTRVPNGAPLAVNSCGSGLLFPKRGKVQHRRTHGPGPRGAQIAAKNHAHPARRAHRTGETSHRRNRVRRSVVREAARVAQTTGRRARRAAVHCFFGRVVAADGAVLSGDRQGIFAHQRRGRPEVARVRRGVPGRDRGAFAIESAPDVRGRFPV